MPPSRRYAVACLVVSALLAVALPRRASAEARYPEGAVHSPMTASIVARLRAVLAKSGGGRSFVKVGDSNTANPSFLRCLASDDVRLGAGDASLVATRAFFRARRVDVLHDSFSRVSVAATPGWLTAQVLAGAPPHLLR